VLQHPLAAHRVERGVGEVERADVTGDVPHRAAVVPVGGRGHGGGRVIQRHHVGAGLGQLAGDLAGAAPRVEQAPAGDRAQRVPRDPPDPLDLRVRRHRLQRAEQQGQHRLRKVVKLGERRTGEWFGNHPAILKPGKPAPLSVVAHPTTAYVI
jgi:hypothetical protein